VSSESGGIELPQSSDAERAVLGAVLVDEKTLDLAGEQLDASHFYQRSHQILFDAMRHLREQAISIDVLTLTEQLSGAGVLEQVGGPGYIAGLTNGLPRLVNVPWYARIVRQKAVRRGALREANRFVDEVQTVGDERFDGLVARLQERLDVLRQEESPDLVDELALDKALDKALEDLHAAQKEPPRDVVGTGFESLGRYLSDYDPSALVVWGARTSQGKTAWALTAARHRADHSAVVYFQSEMRPTEIIHRLLALEARVDLKHLRYVRPDAPLTAREWNRLGLAFERLKLLPLHVITRSSFDMGFVNAKVRQIQRARAVEGLDPISMVILDHLQRMDGSGGNAHERLGEITKAAKALAMREGLCVLALSQLSRADKKHMRKGVPPAPTLADLRESGSIEEDADVVGFIHRPEDYLVSRGLPPGEHEGRAQIIIAKQRQGPVGSIVVDFVKEYALFTDAVGGREGGERAPF